MLYLLLTVACSVLLGFIFKLFARFGIDGFQAIVFNYATCFCCGWLHLGHFPVQAENFGAPWMPYALVLGLIFVSGFNMAALTVRYFGVTIGQIMQKMSILMTVPFAIFAYQESAGWVKIVGIIICAYFYCFGQLAFQELRVGVTQSHPERVPGYMLQKLALDPHRHLDFGGLAGSSARARSKRRLYRYVGSNVHHHDFWNSGRVRLASCNRRLGDWPATIFLEKCGCGHHSWHPQLWFDAFHALRA